MNITDTQKNKLVTIIITVLTVLVIFIALRAIAEYKGLQAVNGANIATITVSGTGDINAVPDIATVSYTVRAEGKTTKDAQVAEAKISKAAMDTLKSLGIDAKDIKTENYNSYPKYSNDYNGGPEIMMYPRPTKQVITGYEASEYVTVKVRKTDDAAKVIEALGKAGVSDIGGPNFTVDDPDKLQADARAEAIDDAKAKAEVLEKQLGVHLGKIVSFSENGNYPMYYQSKGMMTMDAVAVPEASGAPTLSPGEQKITSNVTITYEIR